MDVDDAETRTVYVQVGLPQIAEQSPIRAGMVAKVRSRVIRGRSRG